MCILCFVGKERVLLCPIPCPSICTCSFYTSNLVSVLIIQAPCSMHLAIVDKFEVEITSIRKVTIFTAKIQYIVCFVFSLHYSEFWVNSSESTVKWQAKINKRTSNLVSTMIIQEPPISYRCTSHLCSLDLHVTCSWILICCPRRVPSLGPRKDWTLSIDALYIPKQPAATLIALPPRRLHLLHSRPATSCVVS